MNKILQSLESFLPLEKPLFKLYQTASKFYLYDGGTSKIIECSELEYLILSIYLKGDKNFDLLLHNYDDKNINDALNEIILTIKNEDILQITQFEFVDFANIEEYINNNLLQITLELTEKCNLRCGYCIYNSNYELKRNHGDTVMSWNTCRAAIDYLNMHSTNSESVAITFYGGEPLLEFKKIKKSIEYGKSVIQNKKLRFSLTTNLTLITKEMAEYFASVENLSIVCSLDGPKDLNDLYRVDIKGEGSFIRAITGLKNLVNAFGSEASDRLLFSMVFAPPYTNEHLIEIQSFFDKNDWIPKSIMKLVTYPMQNSVEENINVDILNEWSMSEFLDGKNIFTDDAIKYPLLRIFRRPISVGKSNVIPLNGNCIPGQRKIYVSSKGDISICEKIAQNSKIGNVFNGINLKMIREDYINEYIRESEIYCSKCWAGKLCDICYVGCYKNGKIDVVCKKEKCEAIRDYFYQNLIYLQEVAALHPEVLEDLKKYVLT